MASSSPTLLHLPRELDDHCSVAAQELAAKVDAAVSRQQELCLSRLRGNSSAADEAHGRGESLTAAEAAALASASVPERRSSIEPDDPAAQRAAVERAAEALADATRAATSGVLEFALLDALQRAASAGVKAGRDMGGGRRRSSANAPRDRRASGSTADMLADVLKVQDRRASGQAERRGSNSPPKSPTRESRSMSTPPMRDAAAAGPSGVNDGGGTPSASTTCCRT